MATYTGDKANTSVTEPGYQYPGSYVPVENTPLTSLRSNQQDKLKQTVNKFDKHANKDPSDLGNKIYFISAISKEIDPFNYNGIILDPSYPIPDNKERGISWKWALIREMPSINILNINILLSSIIYFIIAIFIISIAIFSIYIYKIIKILKRRIMYH